MPFNLIYSRAYFCKRRKTRAWFVGLALRGIEYWPIHSTFKNCARPDDARARPAHTGMIKDSSIGVGIRACPHVPDEAFFKP